MKKHLLWWRRLVSRFSRKKRLVVVAGDSLPDILPRRDLVLARDDGEDWCVGLYCPCGCGDKLEMIVLEGVKPRWDVLVDGKGHVSLRPSVWRQNGCKSHFWVIGGKILWCDQLDNATPMGMADTDGFPLRKKLFRPSMFVGDVIAGHGVIAFINAASAVGCKTATGDHMVEAVQETMLDFRLSN